MNLNTPRIHTSEPLTDSDFARLYPEDPPADFRPTRFERIAAVPLAVAIGILGAVALIHWAMS